MTLIPPGSGPKALVADASPKDTQFHQAKAVAIRPYGDEVDSRGAVDTSSEGRTHPERCPQLIRASTDDAGRRHR